LLLGAFALTACASTSIRESYPFLLHGTQKDPHQRLEWETIEVDGASGAEQFAEDRRQMLDALTEPKIDPYTGNDSTPDYCQKAHLPAPERKSGKGNRFESLSIGLFASKKYVLGLCGSFDDILKSQYQMLYCGDNKVYIVKTFYPADRPWLATGVARCPQ
jgi:hypothetical protein